ncbi:hypothetical protein DBV15_08466 [Temnothorax longispinosus]|uniref:Uncharacterized protein n=1 Tax=Temnothorax longispinosus TaxID=300112 RepID=A0A4S2L270_9HYME|nr:hypothetical protein DBV15_08466 [Temnothorax longispinosus]
MEYHGCNWVNRSTETVSVHAKPYRASNDARARLTTANSQLVFRCSMAGRIQHAERGKEQSKRAWKKNRIAKLW